ncbi:ComF family protein [Synechocystis salina]|uniref:ComF family protein n=1 Tax=Synechocystis salina TaxID=945780 RepID=UPI001D15AD52|nr:ComF family protein [Synechocystis salina]
MWQSIRSLLFQTPCPLCQKPSQDQFCRDCTGQIFSHRLPRKLQQWQGNFPRFVWGQYEGQLRRALTVMKFEQQPGIGLWLGEQLAEQWLQQPQAKLKITPQVVPVPLSNRKQAERGFNQAERIAVGFCRLTGYTLRSQALQRPKDTQALFGLSPGDRNGNCSLPLLRGQGLTLASPG